MILESLDRFRSHGTPGSWHVGPSMRPAGLGERLLAHGFTYGGDDIGMTADLSALREDLPVPDDLEIELVRDETTLAAWKDTLARGFGEGPVEAEWVGEMYRRLGLDDVPWRHYLGRLRGEPVATCTLFLGAGVAGVYFVFTVEQARRQGVGAALTLAPLRGRGRWATGSAFWDLRRWATLSTAGWDSASAAGSVSTSGILSCPPSRPRSQRTAF